MPHPLLRQKRSWFATLLVVLASAWLLTSCTGDAPLPGDPLRISNNALPDGVLGEPYRVDIVAVGGLRPYSIRIRDGRLPPGIALQDGLLVGTPSALGAYDVTLEVNDGNLAATFADYTITVRDVPIPTLTIDVPETEVRGTTVLRGRVDDARELQGIRVRIRWDDTRLVVPEASVERSLRDSVLLHEVADGRLALDLARLGEGFTGDAEAFRFSFEASDATILGFDLDVEFLYADRHTFVTRRVGAPASAGTSEASDPDTDPSTDDDRDVASQGENKGGAE